MSLIESGVFKLTGITQESKDVKWYSIAAFSLLAKIDQLVNHPTIEGDPLPPVGQPALVISNHGKPVSFVRGYKVGEINHRNIRVFAKNTLLDYRQTEPEEIRKRTGKKNDLLNVTPESPWWQRKVADLMAIGFKGLGAMPIVRGGDDEAISKFLDKGSSQLKKKQLVGIFAQETRSTKLENPKTGPAVLAAENSGVPIYVIAMCAKRVSIRRLGTYEELWDDPKTHDLAEQNLTVLIFDAIADMSDPEIKDDWYQVQRPKLLFPSLQE